MIFLCDNITPFGSPVVPVVNKISALSSNLGKLMFDGTPDSFKSTKQSNSMTFMLFILFSKQ